MGTYNVLHTQDRDGNPTALQRVGMLAAAIERSGADAMGLQEVAKSANLAASAAAAGLDDGDEVTGLMVELIAQDLVARTGDTWSWCWFASNAHVPLRARAQRRRWRRSAHRAGHRGLGSADRQRQRVPRRRRDPEPL